MARFLSPAAIVTAALAGALGSAAPAWAERPVKARLVHCGAETCLRLSGRRDSATVAVRVDGRDLTVTGARSWQATVPLAEARTWRIVRGYALPVTLVDAASGAARKLTVAVPPGALGSRLELASLIVRAR